MEDNPKQIEQEKKLAAQINQALNHTRWMNLIVYVDDKNQLQFASTSLEFPLDDYAYAIRTLKDIVDREIGKSFKKNPLPMAEDHIQRIQSRINGNGLAQEISTVVPEFEAEIDQRDRA